MQPDNTTADDRSIRQDAALEQLLLGDLLDLLNDPDDPQNPIWLLSVMEALLRIFPKEVSCEDAGGYLQEVLEVYPSWERQVQALHREHISLELNLRELRQEVSQSGLTPHNRRCLYEWIEQVNEHNGRQTALLQTAINLEVGVGD